MSSKTISTLKSYFNTGDKPTEAQFSDLIDTCFAPALTSYDICKTSVKYHATNKTATFTIANVDEISAMYTYWSILFRTDVQTYILQLQYTHQLLQVLTFYCMYEFGLVYICIQVVSIGYLL